MTAWGWVGFLLCLGACYVGARFIYGAHVDAEMLRRQQEEDAIIAAVQADLRRQLRENTSDTLTRTIDEYGSERALQQYHPTDEELTRMAKDMRNIWRDR